MKRASPTHGGCWLAQTNYDPLMKHHTTEKSRIPAIIVLTAVNEEPIDFPVRVKTYGVNTKKSSSLFCCSCTSNPCKCILHIYSISPGLLHWQRGYDRPYDTELTVEDLGETGCALVVNRAHNYWLLHILSHCYILCDECCLNLPQR